MGTFPSEGLQPSYGIFRFEGLQPSFGIFRALGAQMDRVFPSEGLQPSYGMFRFEGLQPSFGMCRALGAQMDRVFPSEGLQPSYGIFRAFGALRLCAFPGPKARCYACMHRRCMHRCNARLQGPKARPIVRFMFEPHRSRASCRMALSCSRRSWARASAAFSRVSSSAGSPRSSATACGFFQSRL